MRYRIQRISPGGEVLYEDTAEENEAGYYQDDAAILARAAIHTIQLNWHDGTRVILGPLEYECPLCGQYGHGEATCPEACDLDTDDPFDEADYEEPVD